MVSETGQFPHAAHELGKQYGVELVHIESYRQARDPALLSQADAVLFCDPIDEDLPQIAKGEKQLLADALLSHRLTGVMLSSGTSGVVPDDDDALAVVPADITSQELWGRINTIRQYRPLLSRMEKQVAAMQRLGKKLNQQFVEVDQELRLASRLQRDFLPKEFPQVGQVGFSALYRPATWVSGDVYDIRRLDEHHVSFLIADAVGHGVAAGLLTMFIRQAVIGKKIFSDGYRIIQPDEVLQKLNTDLAHQELPNCQFVTACYGLIDTRTHEVTFSRGGHPHPIHVDADGSCCEVHTVGGLLGVFEDEVFESTRFTLDPGDKLIIYSDGMENAIIDPDRDESAQVCYTPAFLDAVSQPAEQCLAVLAGQLDQSEGSLQQEDDQTCIVIERLAQ